MVTIDIKNVVHLSLIYLIVDEKYVGTYVAFPAAFLELLNEKSAESFTRSNFGFSGLLDSCSNYHFQDLMSL